MYLRRTFFLSPNALADAPGASQSVHPAPFVSRDQYVRELRSNQSVPAGRPLRKEYIATEIKQEGDPESRKLRVRITTATRDRQNDTVAADGWRLQNFRKNPVVLYGHDYFGLPVGRDEGITQDEIGLIGTPRFTTAEQNPFGDMVYRLLLDRFLNAFSVGFQPIRRVWNEEEMGIDFIEQELLEYSVVPIPANPEALVEARSAGIDLRPMKDYAERFLDQYHEQRGLWIPQERVEHALRLLTPRKFTVPASVVDAAPDFFRELGAHLGPAVEIERVLPTDAPVAAPVDTTPVGPGTGPAPTEAPPAPAPPTAPAPPAAPPPPTTPASQPAAEGQPPATAGEGEGEPYFELDPVAPPAAQAPTFELVLDEEPEPEAVLVGVDPEELRSQIRDAARTAVLRRKTAQTGKLT